MDIYFFSIILVQPSLAQDTLKLLANEEIACYPGKGYNSVHWLRWLFEALGQKILQDSAEWTILCDMGGGVRDAVKKYRMHDFSCAKRACQSLAKRLGTEYTLQDLACFLCLRK